MTSSLKVLLATAGVAALLTSPTLAASRAHHHQAVQPAYHANSNVVVAPNGQVLGADPDVQIRSEMLRDSPGAGAATGY